MLEIVYASEQFLWENSEQFYLMQKIYIYIYIYECSKHIWIYSKHDGQSVNFINVEIDLISAEK